MTEGVQPQQLLCWVPFWLFSFWILCCFMPWHFVNWSWLNYPFNMQVISFLLFRPPVFWHSCIKTCVHVVIQFPGSTKNWLLNFVGWSRTHGRGSKLFTYTFPYLYDEVCLDCAFNSSIIIIIPMKILSLISIGVLPFRLMYLAFVRYSAHYSFKK